MSYVLFALIIPYIVLLFARTKQTEQKSTGGKAPKKSISTKAARASVTTSSSTSTSTASETSTLFVPSPSSPPPPPTSTSSQPSAPTPPSVFSTFNLINESLFTTLGGYNFILRPPRIHEPLWNQDVLSCFFTGAPSTEPEPSQPEDDNIVLLPGLGECSFIRYEPHRFIPSSSSSLTSPTTPSTPWILLDEPSMGMVVELRNYQWPTSSLPIRLLINISNITCYLSLTSLWRMHVLQFNLYHLMEALTSSIQSVPSFICQYTHCTGHTYHFSQDHPSYGVCVDHLNITIDRSDKHLTSLPMPFLLNTLIQRASSLTTTSTTTTTTSPWTPRRCDRFLFCQLVSGMLSTDDKMVHQLFQRIYTTYPSSQGHICYSYHIDPRKRDKHKEFKNILDGLAFDINMMNIDGRFYSSPNFIHIIPIIIHSNGQGQVIIGTTSFDMEDFGTAIVESLMELPHTVNCPIVLFIGSCYFHNIKTYDTICEAIEIINSSVSAHLHIIYFAHNALLDQCYSLLRTFIDHIMENPSSSIMSSFWSVAIHNDYKRTSPRLRMPDGQVHIPHHHVAVTDPVGHTRQVHHTETTTTLSIVSPALTTSSSHVKSTSPTTTPSSTSEPSHLPTSAPSSTSHVASTSIPRSIPKCHPKRQERQRRREEKAARQARFVPY